MQYVEMETPEGHCHSPWQGGHRSITKGIQVLGYNNSTSEHERLAKYLHGTTEDQD